MLAICAALRWEIRPILHAIGRVERSKDGPPQAWKSTRRPQPIIVYRTGIGYEAAAAATKQVLSTLPVQTVVNTGCAGALAGDLAAGSVVIPHFLLDSSNQRYDADGVCVTRLRTAARRAGLVGNAGPTLTSPVVLGSAKEKRAAFERFGATAVDMEGTAVATLAREHGRRFCSARAILDASDLDLPGDAAAKAWTLVLRNLSAPRELAGIMSLANAVKAVQTSLEALFRSLLEESFPPGSKVQEWFEIVRQDCDN